MPNREKVHSRNKNHDVFGLGIVMFVVFALLVCTLVYAKGPFLAIGILSNASNFENRQAVRDSWLKEANQDEVRWKFIVGSTNDVKINEQIANEAKIHNDLLILNDVMESYRGIVAKTKAAFRWAFEGPEVPDFLLKCDDDSYVRLQFFLKQLKHIVSYDSLHPNLYMGSFIWESKPIRNPRHKWYVSPKVWPDEKFPGYALGCGYVVGKNAGTTLVQTKEVFDFEIPVEDVNVGIWMSKIGDKLKGGLRYKADSRIKSVQFLGRNQADLIWHHVTPEEMIQLKNEYDS